MLGIGVNIWDPLGGSRVPLLPEQCFTTAVPVLVYDTTRGLTPGVQWVEQISGLANDRLVSASWPNYTAVSPTFGGRPSYTASIAAHYIQSAVPAAATLIAQPCTRVIVCSGAISNKYIHDGTVLAERGYVLANAAGTLDIYAGAPMFSTAVPSLAPAYVCWAVFNGANSVVRTRGGGVTASQVGATGAASIRGLTCLNNYNLSSSGIGVSLTLDMVLSGIPSIADLALFETWAIQNCGVT